MLPFRLDLNENLFFCERFDDFCLFLCVNNGGAQCGSAELLTRSRWAGKFEIWAESWMKVAERTILQHQLTNCNCITCKSIQFIDENFKFSTFELSAIFLRQKAQFAFRRRRASVSQRVYEHRKKTNRLVVIKAKKINRSLPRFLVTKYR